MPYGSFWERRCRSPIPRRLVSFILSRAGRAGGLPLLSLQPRKPGQSICIYSGQNRTDEWASNIRRGRGLAVVVVGSGLAGVEFLPNRAPHTHTQHVHINITS
jgi:hypothetical protein